MSLAELGNTPGKVQSIIAECDYLSDPLSAYVHLCQEKKNNLLLESAEIESKNSLNSLILIDAALKLVCNGKQVNVTALSSNGEGVVQFLVQSFSQFESVVTEINSEGVTFMFALPAETLDEDTRLKASGVFDVLRVLQTKLHSLTDHPNAIFVAGTFAYDLLATFEALPDVPNGENDCSDYVFYLSETLLLIDHQTQKTQILGSVFSGEQVAQSYFDISQKLELIKKSLQDFPALKPDVFASVEQSLTVDKCDETYCNDVVSLKENILSGDIFQVVPSRTFSLPCPSPVQAYFSLRQSNPSPYMFFIQDEDFCIFGASPESALKYQKDTNQVEIYPIAGTRPRGKRPDGSIDHDLDSRIELTLREDNKEKAEHLMLVDLARNDIARVSIPGTRHVKDLLKVDRYSHVMHLVSRVVGQLQNDLDCLHAYQACMNMGTLVGAPKVMAANLIRKTEGKRRGSYGGAVGYINGHGDMDSCIVIRSAFVKNGIAHVQAGAGVVFDSVPQSEADETRGKAQAVISAIIAAHKDVQDTEE